MNGVVFRLVKKFVARNLGDMGCDRAVVLVVGKLRAMYCTLSGRLKWFLASALLFAWFSHVALGAVFEETRKQAEDGDATAQNYLGIMYAKGEEVPKDLAEAVKWFLRASEQGNASAQCNLGIMYGNGEGVPKDPVEAVKWLRKAAEQGYAKAQFNLGHMYENGEGVPKDLAEAVKWYRKAAEQGYALAQS